MYYVTLGQEKPLLFTKHGDKLDHVEHIEVSSEVSRVDCEIGMPLKIERELEMLVTLRIPEASLKVVKKIPNGFKTDLNELRRRVGLLRFGTKDMHWTLESYEGSKVTPEIFRAEYVLDDVLKLLDELQNVN